MSSEANTQAGSRPATEPGELTDHLFRTRAGQMVAYLTRLLGPQHLDLAEEAVQEALVKALQHWPYSGVPENPAGWLFRVARNAALDAIRRASLASEKEADLAIALEQSNLTARANGVAPDPDWEENLRDDELRMLLMCCHPALSRDASVALSLKTVGGFNTREIARAFLADEATIAQRLVRAKRQIREDGMTLDLPAGNALAMRLDSALETIYLMFNEGYAAEAGEDLVRQDLCGEALRLARLIACSAVGTPQAHALVALLAFQAARLPARVNAARELVLLEEQDRSAWDQRLVALGFHHFGLCAEGADVSPYHLQAAIAAVHAGAAFAGDTDWQAIVGFYDELVAMTPSPVIALNRAVAIYKLRGAAAGLAELESLGVDRALRNYYLLPAIEGRLRMDLGDYQNAARCFLRALELRCSEPEKRFLQRKLAQCEHA